MKVSRSIVAFAPRTVWGHGVSQYCLQPVKTHRRKLSPSILSSFVIHDGYIIRIMTDHSRATLDSAKATFGHLVVGLKNSQCETLPRTVLDFLKANPKISAFQVACLLAFAVPGLIATPALLSIGFGGSGPMAGRCLP